MFGMFLQALLRLPCKLMDKLASPSTWHRTREIEHMQMFAKETLFLTHITKIGHNLSTIMDMQFHQDLGAHGFRCITNAKLQPTTSAITRFSNKHIAKKHHHPPNCNTHIRNADMQLNAEHITHTHNKQKNEREIVQ